MRELARGPAAGEALGLEGAEFIEEAEEGALGGGETVPAGVLRGALFALSRTGPGGAGGVVLVGLETLGRDGHCRKTSLRTKSTKAASGIEIFLLKG